jgi:phosphatidylglycerol---prolipoprotein diacylglyceryl transferase
MHPILFRIGSITIRYYGLMYVIAITLGFILLSREVRRRRLTTGIGEKTRVLTTDDLLDLMLWTIPAAIIGARIYYVAFQWGYYSVHPLDMIKIWQGGLAIHGGVIGGGLAVYLYARFKHASFWGLTDCLVPSLILGQAIGRIGNLMNGDAYGLPTKLPWGIHFPASSPAGMAYPGQATQPSMIYEMILDAMIFVYLWRIRKKGYRAGFSTAMYLILYSIARSIVSFTRGDSLWLGPIRAAHVISAILIFAAVGFIWSRHLYRRATPETALPNRNAEPEDPRPAPPADRP